MMLLDANYILRYLLNDNEQMFDTAKEIIQNETCVVLNEVVAEVVYVLFGIYEVPRETIAKTLSEFISLDNMIMHESKDYMLRALQLFQSTQLDFVDCILCALNDKYTVKTFDKKLLRCLSHGVN